MLRLLRSGGSAGRASACAAVAAAVVLGGATSAVASGGTVWNGSGPGTTTVVGDGSSGPAVFSYNLDLGHSSGASGTWTFSTTSDFTGQVKLPWHWAGLHAWFHVTAQLVAFVTHSGGGTDSTTLVNAGPADCCTTPSNGFDYSGTTTLAVSTGDTYGFTISGSNFDFNSFLRGTLTVGPFLNATATTDVPTGTTISASASLTATSPGAQGSVTFSAYSDSACTTLVHTTTVVVNGDGSYLDPGFVPASAGTYYWTIAYSGDASTHTLGALASCGAATSIVMPVANNSWTRALPITLDSNGDGGATGTIDLSGQARWWKVPITPGGNVAVDLSNLPANYDLAVFSDIGQAYDTVTGGTKDLQKVSAEFGTNAFSPSVFSPSVFSPSVFSPSVFSPSVFSPSVFSPSVFSPSVFSPSVFSPSVFSPSVFSPSVFSPSVFSPSVFSPEPAAYEGAQIRSLLGISANDGTAGEHVFVDTWNNTGFFYIRVNGRNGTYSPAQPFSLHVHVASGTCGGVVPSNAALLQSPPPSSGLQTVILTDYSRMPAGGDLAAMESKVSAFAARVDGAVIDLGASPRVSALNTQADATPDCPYAKNLVAGAIKDAVGAYRSANPGLKYVVIVGSDHVIPFFRYPDTAGLGPESNYVPPVLDNSASQASLQSNDVLSQDAYGSNTVLDVKGVELPIPDLPVGRLVEAPAEISNMLDAYMSLPNGVVPSPHSSLVTGYDFMASGAQSVENDLAAGLGSGATNDTLITRQGVAPSDTGAPPDHSWTADQLRAALLGSRHDLIYFGGHFSANNTLAADYSTTMNSTELASSSVDLTNAIVFSAGCHSGYSIVGGDAVPGVTQPLDWTKAFAEKGATLIAGTGYQYGDTDFLAYSQRLYADFARELRVGNGPVAVGSALVAAKAQYLADASSLGGIDLKSLAESTLYGLPMLSVDLPAGRIAQPTTTSIVDSTSPFTTAPGSVLGLSYFDHTFAPNLTTQTRQLVDQNGSSSGQPVATWLTGPNGVETAPGAPTLPLDIEDVTAGGVVLRGVGFRGGNYADTSGVTPLTGAPVTELNGVHSPFVSSAFFPSRLFTVNYFGGLTGTGGTELMLTPAQYASDAPGSATDVQRAYSNISLRLFYSGNTSTYGGNTPSLAAPPTISRVDAAVSGGSVTFSAHVVGDPSAGIQQVWVTYAGVHPGMWESLDLTQSSTDSTLWTRTLDGLSPAQLDALRFVVQAVNGVGLVSLDDDQGELYRPGAIAPALQTASGTRTASAIAVAASSSGDYGTSTNVSATLTSGGAPVAGEQVLFSLGGATATGLTDANGVATAHLGLVAVPGPYTVTAAFDGDPAYLASSASAPFAIEKLPSALTIGGGGFVVPGTGSAVSATLVSAGVGLAQRTVAFVLTPLGGGLQVVQTRTTDLFGNAALGVVSPLAAGAYSVQAFFGPGGPLGLPADPVYAASSSGTTQITVFAPTAAGLKSLVESLGLSGGLGNDLSKTAANAAGKFARGQQKEGCDKLNAFARRILDVLGGDAGGLTTAQASLLVTLDLAAETEYGCSVPGPGLQAAEQAVVNLVSAILAANPVSHDFRSAAVDLGKTALSGGKDVCKKVASLQAKVAGLPPGQSATIGAALTVVRLDLGC